MHVTSLLTNEIGLNPPQYLNKKKQKLIYEKIMSVIPIVGHYNIRICSPQSSPLTLLKFSPSSFVPSSLSLCTLLLFICHNLPTYFQSNLYIFQQRKKLDEKPSMEFASKTLRHPNFSLSFPSSTIPPSSLPLNPSKTLISFPSSKPFSSIHSSHKSPNSPLPKIKSPNPLSSILTAAATSAALLLFQFHIPPRAVATVIPPPPETSSVECLSDEEKEQKLLHHLDSHPDDIPSLRELMELKIKSGKSQDAISIVNRLMNLEPGENDLPLLKAHLQSYSGDPDSARRGFEDLLSDDPLLVEAYHGLVMVEREVEGELNGVLKRVESALETCKKLKKKEDVRDFKLLIAQIKVIEDKYDEALRIYEELVKEEPRDFRPYLCQGIIYTLMRKKEEAEKQFEKYRRLVPREHPYSRYFDDNMIAMKVFSQVEENKRKESLKI